MYKKEKADDADRKRAQQQGDKLQGKTNFLPWFGGVNELVEKLPKTFYEMQLCMTIKDSMVNAL